VRGVAVSRCGLVEALPLESQSVDGVTCSLALDYLEDWSVALTSFAKVLRVGGWAVLPLDHPSGPPLPSQRGGSFDTELVSDTWKKAGVEVTQWFWRRPLSAFIGAFADHGFVVERLVEPQPSEQALAGFPMNWPRPLASVVHRVPAAAWPGRQMSVPDR
jgi:hypothetical protein